MLGMLMRASLIDGTAMRAPSIDGMHNRPFVTAGMLRTAPAIRGTSRRRFVIIATSASMCASALDAYPSMNRICVSAMRYTSTYTRQPPTCTASLMTKSSAFPLDVSNQPTGLNGSTKPLLVVRSRSPVSSTGVPVSS